MDGERAYYLERARKALELAERAVDPAIAGIHIDMYARYMERAGDPLGRVPSDYIAVPNQR